MKNRKLTISLISLIGLLGALSFLFFNFASSDPLGNEMPDKKQTVEKKGKAGTRKAKLRSSRKTGRITTHEGVTGTRAGVREKPRFELDEDDESKLNDEQRKTINAIRLALDNDDRKTVLQLVQTLQKSEEWPDGIPKSIKMAAIEALGWFGSSCLPELAGFLADADSEVVEAAIERFEEMLSDIDLSDRERSKILVQASKVIDDSDAMDSMLSELNNMRHSVAIETIKQLMAEGGAATKSILTEAIEFYTGEEGLDTPEKLDKWLKENPDDEDDEEFYGASKDK